MSSAACRREVVGDVVPRSAYEVAKDLLDAERAENERLRGAIERFLHNRTMNDELAAEELVAEIRRCRRRKTHNVNDRNPCIHGPGDVYECGHPDCVGARV